MEHVHRKMSQSNVNIISAIANATIVTTSSTKILRPNRDVEKVILWIYTLRELINAGLVPCAEKPTHQNARTGRHGQPCKDGVNCYRARTYNLLGYYNIIQYIYANSNANFIEDDEGNKTQVFPDFGAYYNDTLCGCIYDHTREDLRAIDEQNAKILEDIELRNNVYRKLQTIIGIGCSIMQNNFYEHWSYNITFGTSGKTFFPCFDLTTIFANHTTPFKQITTMLSHDEMKQALERLDEFETKKVESKAETQPSSPVQLEQVQTSPANLGPWAQRIAVKPGEPKSLPFAPALVIMGELKKATPDNEDTQTELTPKKTKQATDKPIVLTVSAPKIDTKVTAPKDVTEQAKKWLELTKRGHEKASEPEKKKEQENTQRIIDEIRQRREHEERNAAERRKHQEEIAAHKAEAARKRAEATSKKSDKSIVPMPRSFTHNIDMPALPEPSIDDELKKEIERNYRLKQQHEQNRQQHEKNKLAEEQRKRDLLKLYKEANTKLSEALNDYGEVDLY